jgi:hypothetical protein
MLVAALVLVPFLDKAFTTDDTFFLVQAKQVLKDPLRPTGFEMVWVDVPEKAANIAPAGPVMAFLLAPVVAAGGAEWMGHLLQLALLSGALLGTVALALRLGLAPWWAAAAGLLGAVTPAVLGMAGTVMPDVPAMALGVLGLERLVAWRQDRRLRAAVLATVLLAVAALTRSHLMLVPAVGALLVAGDFLEPQSWREGPLARWAPAAVAPLVTIALLVLTRDATAQDANLLGAARRLSGFASIGKNVIAFLTHWVLVVPLAVPWVLLRARAMVPRWWVFVLATAGVALLLSRNRFPQFYIAPIAGVGAAVLWDIFADGWKRRDSLQLALGLWLLIPLAPAPYSHLPSKYLLAAVPAAALLVAREMSNLGGARARAALGATCALGIALGVAILRAVAAFAGLGRRAAAELIAPNVAKGHRVWFAGHWGFQWYSEKAGGRILTRTPPYPAPGDLVVTSVECDPGTEIIEMLRHDFRGKHLARLEDASPGGRVMSHEIGAGFFSNAWGYLPWGWGTEPLDTFDLWRID